MRSDLPIPNSHPVTPDQNGNTLIFREMEPKSPEDYKALASRMEEVLIFKNSRPLSRKDIELHKMADGSGPKTDIELEKLLLRKAGFTGVIHDRLRFCGKSPTRRISNPVISFKLRANSPSAP